MSYTIGNGIAYYALSTQDTVSETCAPSMTTPPYCGARTVTVFYADETNISWVVADVASNRLSIDTSDITLEGTHELILEY